MLTALDLLKQYAPIFAVSDHQMDEIGNKLQNAIVAAMIEYATLACEEQRLNCYDVFMRRESTEVDADPILNAPLPTLK